MLFMNKIFTTSYTWVRVTVPQAPKALARHSKSAWGQLMTASAGSLSVKEQMFFIKRLSFLIKANVPILEGLHMVHEQTTSRRQKKILTKVMADVAEGQALSRSLAKFPKIFGEFAISIIKIGETSGILSQNLEYLAEELKKRHILTSKVIGAFVYPAVVATATLGITIFLMVYLFPKITPVFASLHTTLPLSTRIVMAASNFLRFQGGWVVLGIFLFVTIATILINKSRRLRFLFDALMLKLPLFGQLNQHYVLANMTRTLGLLLKSGITLSVAVPLAADTTKNTVYKREFGKLAAAVDRGERVGNSLMKRRDLFPDVLTQMVSVGERSGNLSNTLIYLAELYENEVDDFTKNLSSLIEPALMVTMGVLVGFIAISIITPIYALTGSLHP